MTLPRRGPLSPEERLKVNLGTMASGSGQGLTMNARPVRVSPTPQVPPQQAAGFLAVVEHGDDGTVVRPNVQWVLWVGAATPANALPYDGWYTADVSP